MAQTHGYIRGDHKEKLQARLRRIEGQVRGIQRMVEEEAYCMDILNQIQSYVAASEKVSVLLLKDHIEHCVRESMHSGDGLDERVEELTSSIEKFLKLDRS